MNTREHAYELTSQALVAHYWVKHKLPQLIAEAERARAEVDRAKGKVAKALTELERMAKECREGSK